VSAKNFMGQQLFHGGWNHSIAYRQKQRPLDSDYCPALL